MKLNPECLRDILLYVENADFDETVSIPDLFNEFKDIYSENEIKYHIQQCKLNDFFTKITIYDNYTQGIIYGLTPKAHKFLDAVHSEKVVEKLKKHLQKVGGAFSMAALEKALEVVADKIM